MVELDPPVPREVVGDFLKSLSNFEPEELLVLKGTFDMYVEIIARIVRQLEEALQASKEKERNCLENNPNNPEKCQDANLGKLMNELNFFRKELGIYFGASKTIASTLAQAVPISSTTKVRQLAQNRHTKPLPPIDP